MSGAAGAAAVIAAIEEYFKKYLITCEHLQLDPTVVHDAETIQKRCDALLRYAPADDEKTTRKLQKRLEWFVKYYDKLISDSWTAYGFVKRSKKLVDKGQLQVFPETVNDELTTCTLTQKNYDSYARGQRKVAFIALGVLFGIFAIVGIAAALVLLL